MEDTKCPTFFVDECATKPTKVQREQKNLENVRKMAQEKGWRCLSTEFLGWSEKHAFQCEHGHTWHEWPFNMKNRKQCPVCNELEVEAQRQSSLDMFREIAQARGGKCLSTSYVNQHEKLDWECNLGHKWSAIAQTIKRGGWCPECSTGLGERIAREFFGQIFKAEFQVSYPKWLINPDGNQMELDGYCEALGLAFEHNGIQHYSESAHFIGGKEKFDKRQRDDAAKAKLCHEHHVKLFIIPGIPSYTPFNEVKNVIKKECIRLGVALPPDFDSIEVNYLKAYQPDRLKEIQQVAAAHGGRLISEHYIGATEKLLFECQNHHTFWMAPVSLTRGGYWCRNCAIERAAKGLMATLDDVRKIAAAKGGVCLSEEYLGAHHKYQFRCKLGHEWEATRANIISDKWCPTCADLETAERQRGVNRKDPDGKRGIERCHEIAKQRDGKCLSEVYMSAKAPMRWKCNKDGHEWEACFDSIRRGSWCPHPEHNGGIKLSLEIAQARARKRGGECLSSDYKNNKTKMRWRCHRGHEWEDTLDHITRGRWCRFCPPD